MTDVYAGTMCARCGSTADYMDCDSCEDGLAGHDCGEDTCCCLYPEDNMPCDVCGGKGGWYVCLSSPEWCGTHPRPGHEHVSRGQVEHWTVPAEARHG